LPVPKLQVGRAVATLSLVLSLALAATARADLITWSFAGVFTSVSDPGGHLPGLAKGVTFAGTFTMDASVPDLRPEDPERGVYLEAVADISGLVGGLGLAGPSEPEHRVQVANGYLHGDHFTLLTALTVGDIPLTIDLDLHDSTETIFDTDAIPATPPALDDLDYERIFWYSQHLDIALFADITSLQAVPEPAGGLLLGCMALLAAACPLRICG
jgi:hypothetical protein